MRSLLGACAAAAVGAMLAGCSVEPEPFNPNLMTQRARHEAPGNWSPGMRPLPTHLESPYLPASTRPATPPSFAPATQPGPTTRPIRRIALRDLVHAAVAHNADVRVAGYDPAIKQAQTIEAQAAFDLRFFSQFQYVGQDQLQPTATNAQINPLTQGIVNFHSYQVQSGLRQELPTGGKAELRYQVDQFDRSGNGFPFNAINKRTDPFWTNEVALQITQPLLQNFGAPANTARISIARNNEKVSILDFRLALEKNLAELEKAYWQLVQAEQEVTIRESLVTASMTTAQRLADRRGTPGVTNTEISQANAALASRRADLVRARAQVEDLSDQLKQKMNDPDMPVASGTLILPADAPTDAPLHFDADEQIQAALTYRAELSQQQVKINSAEITVGAARSNLLPKLDLIGTIGFQGLGKTLNQTFENQGRFDHTDFQVGIQLEVPLGNREARAIYSRTQLQRLQAIEQYRALIDQVTLEVKQALREVDTSWKEMIASRQSRIAAADALYRFEEFERIRQPDISPGYINTKLDLQTRLGDEQKREIAAIAGYNVAISALERAKGTLLRYDNVVLEEERNPYEDPKQSWSAYMPWSNGK